MKDRKSKGLATQKFGVHSFACNAKSSRIKAIDSQVTQGIMICDGLGGITHHREKLQTACSLVRPQSRVKDLHLQCRWTLQDGDFDF